jgi:hypothetical protein
VAITVTLDEKTHVLGPTLRTPSTGLLRMLEKEIGRDLTCVWFPRVVTHDS